MRPIKPFLTILFIISGTTQATTIDMSPRPAFLLRTGGFVAQDGPTSVCVYGPSGRIAARFESARVQSFDASADDRRLLVVGRDGSAKMFDVTAGKILWSKLPGELLLGYPSEGSFSYNSRVCVVAGDGGRAVILDVESGRQIALIKHPDREGWILSVALSPDGTRGAFVDLSERLYLFDVATAEVKTTAVTGAWPVRSSADGHYLAMQSTNSSVQVHLRIVEWATMNWWDVG